jgi:hypothetical protein
MKEYKKWHGPAVVEPKLDGVYARLNKDGVHTKTGKPIESVPHIAKAMKRHFKKNPGSTVEGELHRRGNTFEKNLGKFRGGKGRKLKLYVHGEDKPSRLTRHVRRVKGKAVKDEKGLQKVHQKHLRKSFEGSVVKRGGVARKLKPHFDEELPVVGSKVRKDGKAGVVSVMGKDGKVFKVQGSAGESGRAKSGDKATVVYSKSTGGAVRGGKLKAVRNRDFSYEFASARKSGRVVDALRKVLKKSPKAQRVVGVAKKVAKKVPKDIRRGAMVGAMVPFPGATTAGATVGAANILKRKVEDVVRKRTGRPYRMFDNGGKVMNLEPTDVKQLKDKGGLKPGVYRGARPVKALPIFNHEYTVVVPKHADRLDPKLKRKMRTVGGRRVLVSGAYKKGDKLKSALADRVDVEAARNGVSGLKRISSAGSTQAARNTAKLSKDFKGRKYPGIVKNILGMGKNSNSYARSLTEKLTKKKVKKGFKRTPGGDLRVELASKDERILRVKRDKLAMVKDAVSIGGTAAVGVGSLMGGKAALDAAKDFKKTSSAVRHAAKNTTPSKVASAIGKQAKGKVKKSFPAVTKVVRALTKRRRFRLFEAHEFGGRDQLKDKKNNRYVGAWPVAAGLAKGYQASDPKKAVVDLPVKNAQVIRGAYNTGKKIERHAGRGARLARDAKDVVMRKPRRKDAAGRNKKREWEKSWAKKAAGAAVSGAAVLGYASLLRKNPQIKSKRKLVNKALKKVAGKNHNRHVRTVHKEVVGNVRKKVNKYVPDTFSDFSALNARIDGQLMELASIPVRSVSRYAKHAKKAIVFVSDKKTVGNAAVQGRRIVRKVRKKIGGGLHGPNDRGRLAKAHAAIDYAHLSDAIDGALIEFDGTAKRAGWDVRDPRGRSARVFAPGSKRRDRRDKKWHEKADNERKLWKAGMVGSLLLGGAVAARVARRSSSVGKVVKSATKSRPMPFSGSSRNPVVGSGKLSRSRVRKRPDLRPDWKRKRDGLHTLPDAG